MRRCSANSAMSKSPGEANVGSSLPVLKTTDEAPAVSRGPRKSVMGDFQQFKQAVQRVQVTDRVTAVSPLAKDDNQNGVEMVRKLDHLTREIHVTQKLICSKFEKLETILQTRPMILGPDAEPRVDKPGTQSNSWRVSLFKSSRERDPILNTPTPRLPGIQAGKSGAESPDDSPAASPRSDRGAGVEQFTEESDSSRGEQSDTEPGSPKGPQKQFAKRNSLTISTLQTDTKTLASGDNDKRRSRHSFFSSKMSAISGSISAKWVSLVSSYTFTEAERTTPGTMNRTGTDNFADLVNHKRTKQSWAAFTAWNFLDNPDSSLGAKLYDTFEPYFLMLAAVFSLVQTLPHLMVPRFACKTIDFCIDSAIMVDILIRYVASPSRGFAFFKKWLNVVDILAAWPLILRLCLYLAAEPSADEPFLFCLVAIARLLKMMRRFQKIHLLLGAFELAVEAIPVLTYVLTLLTLTFSAAVYLVEPREAFDTLPRSIYFTLVTITTLGYGDYAPTTTAGQLIVSVLTIVSSVYLAMPLGLIGSAFTTVWQDRDRILLMKKTRQAMHTWGFTADDIPMLFKFFDSKGRGALSFNDFREMIVAMRVGLDDKRVRELFKSFDKNGSGRVDDSEFVREMFPQEFFDVITEGLTVSDTASSTGPTHSSKASAPAGSSNASAPEPFNRFCSPGTKSGSSSPRSSIPARSLSVPARSPSGRSYLQSIRDDLPSRGVLPNAIRSESNRTESASKSSSSLSGPSVI